MSILFPLISRLKTPVKLKVAQSMVQWISDKRQLADPGCDSERYAIASFKTKHDQPMQNCRRGEAPAEQCQKIKYFYYCRKLQH